MLINSYSPRTRQQFAEVWWHYMRQRIIKVIADNGCRHKATIWIKSDLLSIGRLGTHCAEIWIKIQIFVMKKMHLKRCLHNSSIMCRCYFVKIIWIHWYWEFVTLCECVRSTCDDDVITNDDLNKASYHRVAYSFRTLSHRQHLAIWEIL